MNTIVPDYSRRDFLKKSSFAAAGTLSLVSIPMMGASYTPVQDELNIVGPKTGYSPQIGTLVSMMNWMRNVVEGQVRGLEQEQLDFLIDDKANTVGAMLMHLAATERFYQIHTFEGKNWGDWSREDSKRWSTASGLGNDARKKIKGNDLPYYLDTLNEVRAHTLNELKKRDDDWLLKVDNNWPWGPTNAYCKWFHVVEHESNHNGQIKFIKARMPS
ncbi:hypothetical protein GCM10011344_36840 [Dokdonia pacifica]|uniref:Tat (Twin-arginine translocation) pathway signal sequence n=1 Tax=Dokdonia pacifica TaxID=1627892 RepID=A0A239AZQ6_9FLAO|nr:DinB family protein [Dokdonia pacifica]GGG32527.1 hypothetical protein GCM10011344_36840 [Dokdonia pacifica]SNS00861.1 Tat (twin-arginine translocation) pathway signal sequence [Dokdonia pacifica]